MEIVVRVDKSFYAAVRLVETSHQVLEQPFHPLAHDAVVVDVLFIIDVIHDDVIGAAFLLADTARVLAETEAHESHAVGGEELAGRPVALLITVAVIVDEALVVLQLGLAGGKQPLRLAFGLADEQHERHAAGKHEVQRNAHVGVHGFRTGAVNLQQFIHFRGRYDILGHFLMKPRARYFGEIGEIILEPAHVILLQPPHAGDALCGRFV